MSKPLVFPALEQVVAATTGRNMTKAAYVAVSAGVVMMGVLTVDPAYEAAHHWVDAVLWACLAFFVFEWVVRLRHAFAAQQAWSYVASVRGVVDTVAAAARAARHDRWGQPQNRVAARRLLDVQGGPGHSRDCGNCAGCWCWNPGRC